MKKKDPAVAHKTRFNELLDQLKQKKVSDRVEALESLCKLDHPDVVKE